MQVGIYLNPNTTGPLVLVLLIMIPSIIAEKLHGPLKYHGSVETDNGAVGIDWQLLLAKILDETYTTVARLGVGELILADIAA